MRVKKAIAALKLQLSCLRSERYQVQTIFVERGANGFRNQYYRGYQSNGRPRIWTREEVLDNRRDLFRQNRAHFKQIYIRPVNPYYVLVDLDSDTAYADMQRAKTYKPCLIVETSQNNYHCWFDLSYLPTTDRVKNAQLWMQRDLNGDPGATGLKQIGQMVSMYNRKPGRGDFEIRIVYAQPGQRAELPDEAEEEQEPTRKRRRTDDYDDEPSQTNAHESNSADRSASGRDFRNACMEIRAHNGRINDSDVIANLMQYSEKIHSNKLRYCTLTVNRARATVRRENGIEWKSLFERY